MPRSGLEVSAFASKEKYPHVAQLPFLRRFLEAHPDQQFLIVVPWVK